ncbi:agmatinase [Blattabacterium cuenoti]|uniref:agmatinase n=1 Tax=Blattabacterium cuenoti TaxID=1653831 RepID=UPI00163D304D|nr:agmatinase [Blattabacterium cuenoti]
MKIKRKFSNLPYKYSNLKNSNIVIVPVPYDYTQTWKKGSKYGPIAFLSASNYIELYDIETDSEVYKKGIFVAPFVKINSNSSKNMIKKVYHITKKFLLKEKFVTLIGGDHSISIGGIRAFGEKYSDMSILHMDAHADLRPIYNGNPYNHACSMYEASKKYPIVQVGIRSMDILEKNVIKNKNVFYMHNIFECKNESWITDVIQRLSNNVFISIDIDVFDPSIAPATGTPEPGGLDWYTSLKLFKHVFYKKNVVGFDIVELLPYKKEFCTDFLTVKLFYKLLSYKYESKLSH